MTGILNRKTAIIMNAEIIKTFSFPIVFIIAAPFCQAYFSECIHYLDVADERKIYTAHYSGEVCVWRYADSLRQWKCAHVVKAHRHWVWETKHVTRGRDTYLVSCSYDHRISVIHPASEKTWFITEPKGRVLTFEIMNDVILAAYDYTLPDSGGRVSSAVLQKFRVTDFGSGSYEAGKELPLRF